MPAGSRWRADGPRRYAHAMPRRLAVLRPVRLLAIAAVAATMLLPAAAHAFPASTTELITRPSGDLPLVAIPSGRSGLIGTSDGALQGGHQTSEGGRHVVFVSDADGLSTLDVDTVNNVYVRDTQTNETELVSRASGAGGAGGNGPSDYPQISDDGTRVVFKSTAQLDPADTGANTSDIYVRDLNSDTTYLAPDSGNPLDPSIDADGSHVAYVTSDAHDAVNDTNGTTLDVYVWQVGTASFELASRLSGASTAALDAASTRTSLSDSGTIVAFETDSAQLDAGDTNGASDVAVRTLSTDPTLPNVTSIASRASTAGGVVGNGESTHPALAGNGLSVAYVSASTNLIGAGADTNGARDVFRKSFSVGLATTRVSVSDGEAQLTNASGSNLPSISDNGDLVAFTNFGFGIAPDDGAVTNETVYLRSITAATTEVVSRATGTGGGAPALFGGANSISGDGRTVAFAGTSADYSADDDDSRTPHVYARRLGAYAAASPNTTLFLDRPTGTGPFTGTSDVDDAQIHPGATSWDGRFVGFTSEADNLVPGQGNAFRNGFVRDTVTGTTELVNGAHPGSAVARVAVGANGRSALYVPDGSAYVRDLDTDTEEIVSRADGPAGAVVGADPSELALSGDGSRAAFVTSAALDAADTNGVNDVYVRDLGTDDTILASRADDEQAGGGVSGLPSLNWDGTVVAFASVAANLVGAGGDANGFEDVFVRDLGAGTTVAASRADGTAGALGDDASTMPAIDGDGDTVAFATEAANFGGPGGTSDVAVRELATADTTAFGSTGREEQPAISDDGRRVALVSNASLAGAADTTPSPDVYVYDRDTSTFTFLSRATGVSGIGGDLTSGGNSVAGEGPSISGNGDCVVFPSTATNLDPDWSGTGVQLGFLRTIGTRCPDVSPPDTTIDDGPSGTITTATPSFSFSADEARVTFSCALDGGTFGDCTTVLGSAFAEGAHTVRIRATDVVGNTDPTPAERAFTVDLPGTPPPPAPAPPPADPAPGTTASGGGTTAVAATPKSPAKLKVLRAGIDDGVLDMLVEITSAAATPGADLDFAYESSGRTTRFSLPLSGSAAAAGPRARTAEKRISVRRRLPSTQPKDTGIVGITYAGNSVVSPDEVRLRAADVKASLVRKLTTLGGGRLKVEGTISSRARGVVRLRLGYDRADGTTGFQVFTATIAKGAWKLDRQLTGDAAKGGYLSIQFTGYEPENMRGEQTGKAVP